MKRGMRRFRTTGRSWLTEPRSECQVGRFPGLHFDAPAAILPSLDADGMTAGRDRYRIAADDAAGQYLALRIHHFETRPQRRRQRLLEARGVLGIEERATAKIRPAAERGRELGIVEREPHDADARADAGLAQFLDFRGRVAAAGFLAVGDQHDEFFALH